MFDEEGRTSFEWLQERMDVHDTFAARRLARHYLIFDVLHVGATPTLDLPYTVRQALEPVRRGWAAQQRRARSPILSHVEWSG